MNYNLDPQDSQIVFYTLTYHDADRAIWHAKLVREHYPDVRHVIQSDGDDDPRIKECKRYGAEVRFGDRLFRNEKGGEIHRRMMEVILEGEQDYLFRTDTDTRIIRRFSKLPLADYFGTKAKTKNFIQGGCVGMSRSFCKAILGERAWEDPLIPNREAWIHNPRIGRKRQNKFGLLSFDWTLSFLATKIGVAAFDFDEIASFWKPVHLNRWRQTNPDAKPAVIHPHKTGNVGRKI